MCNGDLSPKHWRSNLTDLQQKMAATLMSKTKPNNKLHFALCGSSVLVESFAQKGARQDHNLRRQADKCMKRGECTRRTTGRHLFFHMGFRPHGGCLEIWA